MACAHEQAGQRFCQQPDETTYQISNHQTIKPVLGFGFVRLQEEQFALLQVIALLSRGSGLLFNTEKPFPESF